MEFLIDKDHDGVCVRDFLQKEVKLSGAMLRHLKFFEDGITVDGSHVTVRHILKTGELLRIKSEDECSSENIEPCDIPLDIAYEDDNIIVPDKPPYMPTHPSHGHYTDTVANALAFRYSNTGAPFVFRPVNRLDRNTSGLLIIAKNRMSAAKMSGFMKKGRVKKEYIAVLDGVPKDDFGVIDTYMKRTDKSIIVRRVCDEKEGGDRAVTRYSVIYSEGSRSIVRAIPVTGRTHQLRVHFAYIGCPIVGDDMYGKESECEYIGRHALHAAMLSFPSYDDETETQNVRSLLPEDMEALVKKLFSADAMRAVDAYYEKEWVVGEKDE